MGTSLRPSGVVCHVRCLKTLWLRGTQPFFWLGLRRNTTACASGTVRKLPPIMRLVGLMPWNRRVPLLALGRRRAGNNPISLVASPVWSNRGHKSLEGPTNEGETKIVSSAAQKLVDWQRRRQSYMLLIMMTFHCTTNHQLSLEKSQCIWWRLCRI